MSTAGDRWTCESCGVVEALGDAPVSVDEARRLVQAGHAERHAAEQRGAQPITAALVDAIETLEAMRVRLVVAPVDLERLRDTMKRRGWPIDVYADPGLPPGRGYVVQPRRGVRELRR